ncbi:zinc-containing alcohol dehydrogenase [Xylariaceae sp. FL0255]|nr:zinc-containing alcohol dehydrogenase [Xylariaceae sp. FL0255]
MATQTVFRFVNRTGFDGLQPFKEPIPAPGPGEILIKIRSVGLNYRDIAIATGNYPMTVKENVIPCIDMASEIVKLGPMPKTNKMAGHVTHTIPTLLEGGLSDGFLCEYVALPAHVVIKLENCTIQEDYLRWSVAPCVLTMAWNSLYGLRPILPGQTVVCLGTGGVSIATLLLAKAAGATTIITSSSDEKLATIKAGFGADHTINYRTILDWAEEVQKITCGRGAEQFIDIGGQGTLVHSLEAAALGGVVTIVGFLAPEKTAEGGPDPVMLILNKACIVRGVLGGTRQQQEDAYRCMIKHELKLPVDKTFGFSRDEIIASLEYLASGAHIGKVAISLA